MKSFRSASLALAAFAALSTATVLPPFNGTFNVAVEIKELVDPSRPDPWSNASRAIMVSVFYPIASNTTGGANCTTPYMTPAVAAAEDADYADYGWGPGTFEQLFMPVCNMSTDSPLATGAPVVLLSPALATSRFFYNGMAESIAGAGYIVAVVDHPYDASLVEFPDGSTVTGVNVDQPGNTSQIILDTEVRAQDMIFTLNQLGNGTFQLGRPSSSGAGAASSSHSSAQGAEAGLGLDTSRALAAGHSLGGAAAAAAMMLDSRFVGCFNLDGEFLGPVTQTGLNGPVMIFASNGTDLNTKQLWTAEWPILRGWKLLVRLLPSQHMSLSDTPLLVTTLNGNNVSESAVAESGPLSGIRVRAIVQAYMTSFFHFALTNQTASILQGPDPTNYPEVTYPGSPANLPQDDPPDRDGDDGPDDGDGSGSGNSTSTANNGKSTSGTGSGNIQPGGSISGSNAGGSDDGDD